MCVNSYTQFEKCGHINTALTPCPTYHKQQASAKGFFGSLFRRNIRARKNCGKVIPGEIRIDAFCDSCSIKKQRLRGEEVGKGALRVRKQGLQEIFQEERREAARNALYKVEKELHHPRSTKTSNHDIIHVESSVWLNDLYYHPETLARKEAYARQAARAPPVSQSQQQVRNRKPAVNVRAKPPAAKIQERRRESESADRRGEWMPSYGAEKPLRRPLPPAAAHGSRKTSPSLPPAVGLLPRPLQNTRQDPRSRHPQPQRNDKQSFAARAQAKGYPDPRSSYWPERYSPPRTHPENKTSASSSSPSSSKPSEPSSALPPLRTQNRYDAAIDATREQDPYLHARYFKMRQVEDELMYRSPASHGVSTWHKDPTRWETRKAALAGIVEKTRDRRERRRGGVDNDDNDSDISFVCQTSRAISGDKDKDTKNKKRSDGEGKKKKSGERQRRQRR